MKAAGAYVFQGMFTQGVLDAGYDVVGVVEDGTFGVETAMINHPHVPVFPNRDQWPIAQLRESELDLLFGNPACAGFSLASSKRAVDNQLNFGLIRANLLGWQVLPKAFVVESVSELFTLGAPLVQQWEAQWQKRGYQTCRLLENSHHLGLPQVRKRALFIAAKANLDFDPPRAPAYTLRDAIGDLADVPCNDGSSQPYAGPPQSPYQIWMRRAKKTERMGRAYFEKPEVMNHVFRKSTSRINDMLPHLLPGVRFRNIPDEIYERYYWVKEEHQDQVDPLTGETVQGKRGKPGFLYARLKWDSPSWVITGNSTYYHPDAHRHLTVRENARVMGVPDHFQFLKMSDAYAEVGKAVSPLVGKWIASQLAKVLEDPQGREHHQMIDLRKEKPVKWKTLP